MGRILKHNYKITAKIILRIRVLHLNWFKYYFDHLFWNNSSLYYVFRMEDEVPHPQNKM